MLALEDDADILPLGMALGIFVVFYESGLSGVDGVVAAHGAVFAGEPVRAPLAEYYVAGNYVLFCFALLSAIWEGGDREWELEQEQEMAGRNIPPDFLAPSRLPGPSFALFTAPCAA